MATSLSGVKLSTAPLDYVNPSSPKHHLLASPCINLTWNRRAAGVPRARQQVLMKVTGPPTPPGISEKVKDSIKAAKETCADDPVSGECAAAWDEVEELSAAASHARDRQKADSDPLETFCKDNPETDECRTYED